MSGQSIEENRLKCGTRDPVNVLSVTKNMACLGLFRELFQLPLIRGHRARTEVDDPSSTSTLEFLTQLLNRNGPIAGQVQTTLIAVHCQEKHAPVRVLLLTPLSQYVAQLLPSADIPIQVGATIH